MDLQGEGNEWTGHRVRDTVRPVYTKKGRELVSHRGLVTPFSCPPGSDDILNKKKTKRGVGGMAGWRTLFLFLWRRDFLVYKGESPWNSNGVRICGLR